MNGPALQERPSASASWRIALPHTAAAVPVARALVRTALAELEHTADSDTAELLTATTALGFVASTAHERARSRQRGGVAVQVRLALRTRALDRRSWAAVCHRPA